MNRDPSNNPEGRIGFGPAIAKAMGNLLSAGAGVLLRYAGESPSDELKIENDELGKLMGAKLAGRLASHQTLGPRARGEDERSNLEP